MNPRPPLKTTLVALAASIMIAAIPAAATPLGAAPGPVPGSGQEDSAPAEARVTRLYQGQFLPVSTLLQLAAQLCSEVEDELCTFESGGGGILVLNAREPIHERFVSLLAERDVPPASQQFQVFILVANGEGGTERLPSGPRAALEDLRGFLPYSGYRVLDSGWLRTSAYAAITLGEAGAFSVELRFEGDPRAGKALLVEFELAHRPWSRDEATRIVHYMDPRDLLQTSFGIDVGETVVVGTSKLDGEGEALIVLLSAVE